METAQVNSCKFRGKIVVEPEYSHEYDSVAYYSMILAVSRKSGYEDKIHIFISSDKLYSVPLHKGDKVEINGYLINSRVCNKKDVSVIATNVEEIEDGQLNIIELEGTVANIYPSKVLERLDKTVQTLIVRLDGDDSVTVKLTAWNKHCEYVKQHLDVGSRIHVKCRLESKSRYEDEILHEGSILSIMK